MTRRDSLFAHHQTVHSSLAKPSRIVALHARRPQHRMGFGLFTKEY